MIRIRHAQGAARFPFLPTATGGELQAFIEKETGIPAGQQQLMTGYPPHPLVLAEGAALSDEVKAGDTVIVSPKKDGCGPTSAPNSTLTLKVIPDDNSCLFNSIAFLFERRIGIDLCTSLRLVVSQRIASDAESYPDVVLGQSRDEYIEKMRRPETWGGGIELAILSEHYETEIDSIDVASGVIHRFGQDRGYQQRGIVVYSGIHYDVLTKPGTGETLFPTSDDSILKAAQTLCDRLKQQGYYTDTANFTLRCKQCGQGVKGEKEAVQHAKLTGHGDFGEVTAN